jgi:uncharacterized repeat protein (TIGR02543 family)
VKKINRLVVALSIFLGYLTVFNLGSADATLTFRTPVALANAQGNFQDVIGPDGNLYTADYSGYVYVNSGVDGSAISTFRASNRAILGLAIDASGNVWVSSYESFQNTSISEFTSSGTFLQSIALQDTSGGYPAGSAGLAISPSGSTIYEYFNNGDVISATTSGSVSSTPLFHVALGSGGSNATSGIAVDSSGNIWVTSLDRTNQLWQYSSTGVLLHTFTLATLPEAIAVDQSGNVWVASINNGRSMFISELTSGSSTFITAGQATNTGCPAGLTVGLSGNLWISDVCNLKIQKVIVTAGPPTFAVSYSSGYYCYVNCSGNSGTPPATQSAVAAGSTFVVPANSLTYAGHTFVGWNDGTTTYQPGATYTMGSSGNFTLTAQWIIGTTDTISFDSQGGSAVASMSGSDGSTITLPSTSQAGYTFIGWFVSPTNGSTLSSPYTLSGSVTLYAQWTPITPPIIYSKPSAPGNVAASITNGTATVSFSPGSSGNLPTYDQIDMYINGVLAGNVCNVTGASSCPISNLGPDVIFTFTITAINSKGSTVSALSNPVSYASPSLALPTATTTTTVPPAKKTITCVKGAVTKKVTAINPVCPAGYKKK